MRQRLTDLILSEAQGTGERRQIYEGHEVARNSFFVSFVFFVDNF